MSKSILIVDTPNSCDECKFETETLNCGKPMCVATPYRRERIDDDSTRPSWCPLSPLPQKGTMENVVECEYNRGFVDGRNHCIDLIVGETE